MNMQRFTGKHCVREVMCVCVCVCVCVYYMCARGIYSVREVVYIYMYLMYVCMYVCMYA